jgi:hypothetical protein
MCFGRQGGVIVGIILGLLIIVAGVISLLEGLYPWATWNRLWPFFIIIAGVLIVLSMLRTMLRR